MKKFIKVTSAAATFPLINIDTDMIIPKQFLKTIKKTGLGKHLFHELRFHDDGTERKDFILNKKQYRQAQILIAGDNFGCGSSREHAPWALADFGISCIIAPSFADIFYNNCFKNSILPICLPQNIIDQLAEESAMGANAKMSVDLASQQIISPAGTVIGFDIDPYLKQCLLEGLDDIALTLKHEQKIANFEEHVGKKLPWL